MRGVKHLGRGPAAVQDFAPEPFAGVNAAAFGEILRPDFPGELGNFAGFGDARMILPEPGHGRRVGREFFLERKRLAAGVHRQGRAAGGVHAKAGNLLRFEAADVALGVRQRALERDFGALQIIGGMLARQVGVARKDNTRVTVLVIPNGSADFPAIRGVHHQGAYRVGSVIQSDGVFGTHGKLRLARRLTWTTAWVVRPKWLRRTSSRPGPGFPVAARGRHKLQR